MSDTMNGHPLSSPFLPHPIAVANAEVAMSPDLSGWKWASGKDLNVPIPEGGSALTVDDEPVLLKKSIADAVQRHVPRNARYLHTTVATRPGRIDSIELHVDDDSLSNCLLYQDCRVVTSQTRGTFAICASSSQPSVIDGSPPTPDFILKHRGTWHIARPGQNTFAEELVHSVPHAQDKDSRCRDTSHMPQQQFQSHARECYLIFMAWGGVTGHAAVAWQHVNSAGVACPVKSVGFYPSGKNLPFTSRGKIVMNDHDTFSKAARVGGDALALFVVEIPLRQYNASIYAIPTPSTISSAGPPELAPDNRVAGTQDFLVERDYFFLTSSCRDFISFIAAAAGLRTGPLNPPDATVMTSSQPTSDDLWITAAQHLSPQPPTQEADTGLLGGHAFDILRLLHMRNRNHGGEYIRRRASDRPAWRPTFPGNARPWW